MEEAEYRHNHSCTVCRRKKVRCDGLKPTCSSCQHAGFPEDCEYITHRSISQDELLEEQIRVLHLRIHQLENPQVHDTLVLLHRPYAPHAPLPSPSIVPETSYETFLSNPGDTPFFFDSDTLRSFLSNATNRSSPSCMYLLAAMSITQASKTTKNLNHKPRAALGLRGDALQDKEHMSKLFTIQAELLMACHFMRFGQLLEARFHSCSAIALALFLNLHKFNYATESSMLEVKQHISAFWFICRNDWLLAIMQNTKTNLPLSIHSATPAMPWPSDFRSEDVQPFRPVMSEWLDEPHSIERYPTSLNALNMVHQAQHILPCPHLSMGNFRTWSGCLMPSKASCNLSPKPSTLSLDLCCIMLVYCFTAFIRMFQTWRANASILQRMKYSPSSSVFLLTLRLFPYFWVLWWSVR
ncbi:hypothetical protein DL96DRAFT_424209 [Flagelloscypha sp. PMI_526]|nr:hypothetical protein DL96DRAFT_424209 [Flagelloscypha sp. PMI_526]